MKAAAFFMASLTAGCLMLAGCGEEMEEQPKRGPYEAAPNLPHRMAAQQPPAGTVARGAAEAAPPAEADASLVARGRNRFAVYCAPCHGSRGRGNGEVVSRGFPAPPSLHSPRLQEADAQHFYQVISNGYGVMYGYGDRVSPPDRWAIIAYIRALQLAEAGTPPTEQVQ